MAFRGEKANQVCPLEFLNSKIQVLALAFTLTAMLETFDSVGGQLARGVRHGRWEQGGEGGG